MRFTAVVLALLGTASVAGAQGTQVIEAPREIGAPLVFEIMVRQYGADNQTAGSAGTSGTSTSGKFESYVWTNTALCGLSASSSEPVSVPGVGWHFTGTVLSSSPGMMSIRVDWQRLWDKGVKVQAGPAGSQTITLREGERLELDRVLPVGQGTCATANARLEAAVITRPAYLVGVANDRLTAARGAAMAGGRGGGRGGRGAGTTVAGAGVAATGAPTTVATGRGTGAGTGGGRGGRGAGTTTGVPTTTMAGGTTTAVTTSGAAGGAAVTTGGRGGRGAGGGAADAATARGRGGFTVTSTGQDPARMNYMLTTIGRDSYDAELWLVHHKPDGTEIVQQQSGRFGGAGTTYTFPPIQVPTSKGVITLDITGKLQAYVGEAPDPSATAANKFVAFRLFEPGSRPPVHVMVVISRRARAAGTPLLDITGGSSIAIEVPSPTDVLSFEFPALQKAAEDLLKGHQFSLRVRVTPVAR